MFVLGTSLFQIQATTTHSTVGNFIDLQIGLRNRTKYLFNHAKIYHLEECCT